MHDLTIITINVIIVNILLTGGIAYEEKDRTFFGIGSNANGMW